MINPFCNCALKSTFPEMFDYFYHGPSGMSADFERHLELQRVVRGVAVYQEDIFVAEEGSCEIKLFEYASLEHLFSVFLADLEDPWDILVVRGILYVTEKNRKLMFKMVTKTRWEEWILSSTKATLSSTFDENILASCEGRLVEFNDKGTKIREILLEMIDQNPWRDSPLHAVKLSRMGYAVCDSRYQHHRIIRLSTGGSPIRAYGEPAKLEKKPLRRSHYLARCRDDFILVADQDNDRILMISPDLEPVKELVRATIGLHKPFRMCLDEVKERLYVVGESQKTVSIFNLEYGLTPLF